MQKKCVVMGDFRRKKVFEKNFSGGGESEKNQTTQGKNPPPAPLLSLMEPYGYGLLKDPPKKDYNFYCRIF